MKASELITLLQDAIDKYGDLPVITFEPYTCERSETVVEPWTEDEIKNVYNIDETNPTMLFVG